MAKFKSIVTDGGSEALTALIASGQKLILTRAAAGSGVAQASPNTLTDLVNVENVSANLSEKELVEGSPSIMQIPVQVTNEGLESNVWIREIGVFGLDISGNEILFCYGWLDGEDSDNVLPATTFEEDANTVHIHDLAVFITNQEAAAVSPGGRRFLRDNRANDRIRRACASYPGRNNDQRNDRRNHGTGSAAPGQRHSVDP